MYRWLAKLVIQGTVSKAAIGMRLGQAHEEAAAEVVEEATETRYLSPGDQTSPTVQQLIKKYGNSKTDIKALFNLVRQLLSAKIGAAYLPCEKNPLDLTHHYIVHKFDKDNHSKFRLRCDKDTCRHGLATHKAWEYIARFIDSGEVSRGDVGLPPVKVSCWT